MFTEGQKLHLRQDYKTIECENSKFTDQLSGLPEDTEFTVVSTRTGHAGYEWVNLRWVLPNGEHRQNSYALQHFKPVSVQTPEELIEENASLAAQINKLEALAVELARRIEKKKKFYVENTASIKASIPEEVRKYAPYL